IGDALEFDGDGDYIEVPHSDSLNTTEAVTVAMWAWASEQRSNGAHQLIEKGPGSSAWFSTFGLMTAEQYMVDNLGVTSLHSLTFRGTSTPGRGDGFWSDDPMPAGEWTHIAVTFDVGAEGNNRKIYLNGEVIAEDRSENPLDTNTERLLIGADAYSTTRWWWHGMLNDVRIYNNALTEAEVLAVMAREPLPFAFGPDPRDGTMLDVTWANISWKAGDFAVSHNLYLGTSFDDVNEGAEGTFVGNLATTSQIVGFASFPVPGGLQPGTTYYWRVDEVNDADPNSPWKGDVWSFWIQPRTAYDASPADGAINVVQDATLGWTPGMGASLHQVYFGDNPDDVSSASGAMLQQDTTYTPSALEVEKTYYWRVDEFDSTGTTHAGDVWSFTTVPDIAITDPDLQGWWTFEEGQGSTVVDWSGHGNHGTVEVQGDPLWVDGYQVAGMDMAGKTTVQIPAEAWSAIENQVTIALWVYGDPDALPRNNSVFWASDGSNRVAQAHLPWSNGNVYFDTGGAGWDRIFKAASPGEYEGSWRHWTFVKNAETGDQQIYLDGELWYSETGMTLPMTGVRTFALGSVPDGSNPYNGIIRLSRLQK
ncbi:MAG: LamG domain-containing protein, partial [Planctomycetota bacterium]